MIRISRTTGLRLRLRAGTREAAGVSGGFTVCGERGRDLFDDGCERDYQVETAWSDSGGEESSGENEPLFQAVYPLPDDSRGRRGVPDVSFDGNPSTGFAIYNSVNYLGFVGWYEVGGTSAGSPQWAALFAIANSTRVAGRKRLLTSMPGMLYTLAKASYATYFHDVTAGSNGTCGLLCVAGTKYDFVTGLGTPRAEALVPALVGQP